MANDVISRLSMTTNSNVTALSVKYVGRFRKVLFHPRLQAFGEGCKGQPDCASARNWPSGKGNRDSAESETSGTDIQSRRSSFILGGKKRKETTVDKGYTHRWISLTRYSGNGSRS